jgi:acetylornithine deacetylase
MGACDTTWLQQAGIPALVYGPGNGKIAHAANEHVRIAELVLACRTYATVAVDWCGVAAGTRR